MRVSVGAGTYVVAVSGGVDSMVLLDIMRKRPGAKLIVAHYDHGIRPESDQDRKLVQTVAKKYQLPFVHDQGKLGPRTSEAAARSARYAFLHRVKDVTGAKAILTAHHQDDLIETAIINILRGSGRRGMTSLRSTDGIIRPLLTYDKAHIKEYAQNHALAWHEDVTNQDDRYLRNHIRHNVLSKFSDGQKAQLVILINQLTDINDELDARLVNMLHTQPARDQLDRQWFVHLPHDVAKEVLHAWLRRHGVKNMSKRTIERLLVAMKTAQAGTTIDVDKKHVLGIGKRDLALHLRER